jgi:hypothetical protein
MGRGWGTDYGSASKALLMGKPAETDRPYLQSLHHPFTLDGNIISPPNHLGLRGRSHREVKDLATSMIANLLWPIASTNQHAALREAVTTPFEAC